MCSIASRTACPFPDPDWYMTRAPCSLATSVVPSEEFPSMTRTFSYPRLVNPSITSPIVSASFKVGMSTQTSSLSAIERQLSPRAQKAYSINFSSGLSGSPDPYSSDSKTNYRRVSERYQLETDRGALLASILSYQGADYQD